MFLDTKSNPRNKADKDTFWREIFIVQAIQKCMFTLDTVNWTFKENFMYCMLNYTPQNVDVQDKKVIFSVSVHLHIT